MILVAAASCFDEDPEPVDLSAGRRQGDPVLTEVSAAAGDRIGALYREIWEPIGGGGRGSWSDDQWAAELEPAGVQVIVGQIEGSDIAMAQLGWSGNGDAAFVVIGVVPDMQGRGVGGDFLTRLIRRMWSTPAPNGRTTQRLWLWTVHDEHPHTIPTYLARGFVCGPDLP